MWLLNNDIDMPPSTLALLLETLERRPDWGAVAPVAIDPAPPFRVLGAGMMVGRTRARVPRLFSGESQVSLPAEQYVVKAVEGAAPLIRLTAIDAVGGLDNSCWMHWEDPDWWIRARAAGWRIGVDPPARVSHLASPRTLNEQRTELMISNRVRFAGKIGTLTTQRLLFRAYFILGWLPLCTFVPVMPHSGVRSGARMSGRLLLRALRRTAWEEGLD